MVEEPNIASGNIPDSPPPSIEREVSKKKPRISRNFVIISVVILLIFLVGISIKIQSAQKNTSGTIPTSIVSPTATIAPTQTPTATPTSIPVSKQVIPTKVTTPSPTPTVSITPTPGQMGFTFDNTSPQVGIVKGGCVDAFVFTSKGSTAWHFSPMTFYADNTIYWEKTSGTATNGEMIKQRICAKADFPYSSPGGGAGGPTTFYDDTTHATQQINVNVRY